MPDYSAMVTVRVIKTYELEVVREAGSPQEAAGLIAWEVMGYTPHTIEQEYRKRNPLNDCLGTQVEVVRIGEVEEEPDAAGAAEAAGLSDDDPLDGDDEEDDEPQPSDEPPPDYGPHAGAVIREEPGTWGEAD
jgi:hypothetical protein